MTIEGLVTLYGMFSRAAAKLACSKPAESNWHMKIFNLVHWCVGADPSPHSLIQLCPVDVGMSKIRNTRITDKQGF